MLDPLVTNVLFTITGKNKFGHTKVREEGGTKTSVTHFEIEDHVAGERFMWLEGKIDKKGN